MQIASQFDDERAGGLIVDRLGASRDVALKKYDWRSGRRHEW
ncbi:hypothetical protein RRSWK_03331 [Rhodopirellula sp. SWK7]|nr:hypothetical protein RRSWK_03331 [Rhodopirellula sp. SWK7]